MSRRKLKVMGDWREKAACKTQGPTIFYPERAQNIAKQAKAVCKTCPVREECLEEALINGEAFGIWGGMDALERRREARRRKIHLAADPHLG